MSQVLDLNTSKKNKLISFLQVGPGIGPITNNNFRFAKALHERGYDVDMVGTKVSKDVCAKAPKFVNVVDLNVSLSFQYVAPIVSYLNTRSPEAIFCSGPTTHITCGLARMISRYKGSVVYRSHIETSLYLSERSWLNRTILLSLMRKTKNLCDYNVAASRGAADDLAQCLKIASSEVNVLYNPCIDDDMLELSNQHIDHKWLVSKDCPVIITAARLADQKSIDVLLKAFQIVLTTHDARLIILGDGPLRDELIELADLLEISEKVDFAGHVGNPYAYMRQADLFVLSAKYEGFANVVAEALAVGCPVVSTDAPSGPREILRDGEFGQLVPVGNYDALAKAMIQSLFSSNENQRLKERGRAFHAERLVDDLLCFVNK